MSFSSSVKSLINVIIILSSFTKFFCFKKSSFRFSRSSFSLWQIECEIYVKYSYCLDYENIYYGYRILVTGGEHICDIYLVYTCTW